MGLRLLERIEGAAGGEPLEDLDGVLDPPQPVVGVGEPVPRGGGERRGRELEEHLLEAAARRLVVLVPDGDLAEPEEGAGREGIGRVAEEELVVQRPGPLEVLRRERRFGLPQKLPGRRHGRRRRLRLGDRGRPDVRGRQLGHRSGTRRGRHARRLRLPRLRRRPGGRGRRGRGEGGGGRGRNRHRPRKLARGPTGRGAGGLATGRQKRGEEGRHQARQGCHPKSSFTLSRNDLPRGCVASSLAFANSSRSLRCLALRPVGVSTLMTTC